MNTAITNQIAGLLGLAMLAGVAVFLYLYIVKANWRASPLGRHMLYFMVALALVLIIRVIGFFWPGMVWLAYVRIVTYALLVAVIWQRVYLLVRSLKED